MLCQPSPFPTSDSPHSPFPLPLQTVIQVSKEFLPSLSIGFEDPRVEVHMEDGNEFMKRHRRNFDVIITDSSDPIGTSRRKMHAELIETPY